MFKSLLIAITLSFILIHSFAQQEEKSWYVFPGLEENGDTVAIVELDEVVIYPEAKKRTRRQKRRVKQYRKLIYNVRVAYPYAKLANKMLEEMNQHFLTLDKEHDQKKYVKHAEKELVKEFSNELKELTISQGRILIKLIDRETGNTSFEIVKELRGSLTAFFWQTMARMFGSNLKDHYDPVETDKAIEYIVTLLENGKLRPVPRKIPPKKKVSAQKPIKKGRTLSSYMP